MKVKTGIIAKITGFLFFLFFAESAFLFAGGAREEVINTEITIQMLKEHWKAGVRDLREGIYIQYNGNDPYLFGILKYNTLSFLIEEEEDDDYELADWYFGIHLYGPRSGGWQEGDVQVYFMPDDKTERDFTAAWYSRSGRGADYVEASFYDDDCSFRITFPGGVFSRSRTDYYERIFPFGRDPAREMITTGTGFLLNSEGYVVTNYHVIEGQKHILVRGINGDFEKAYSFTAVLSDEKNDVAILKPEVTSLRLNNPSYGFNSDEASVGSSVFALGYPERAAMGDEIKLTNGIISSRSGYQGSQNEYQTTASVNPGNSGGPLFNEQGNVIGINSSHLRGANNVYYAVKIRYVRELIENSGQRISIPSNRRTIWGRNLSENVEAVKNFVYMIEAY